MTTNVGIKVLFDARQLRNLLRDALLFASKDRNRPVLTTMRIDSHDGRLRFTATDSYAAWRHTTEVAETLAFPVLVPRSLLDLFVTVLAGVNGLATLRISDDEIGLSTPTVTVTGAQFVDAPFPNIDHLYEQNVKRATVADEVTFSTIQIARLGRLSTASVPIDKAHQILRFRLTGLATPAVITAGDTEIIIMPTRQP